MRLRAAHHLLAHALERSEMVDVLADLLDGEYPWLGFLPEHERRSFLDEFSRVLRTSATVDRFSAFDQMIEAWKSTAEIYADPELFARLGQPGDDAIPAPSPLSPDVATSADR